MPYITLKDRRIYYEDRGTGFPILFGHSYLWDAAMWEPQLEALSASYHCIAPDLAAHGRSDPPPETAYSVEALAEDHWAVASALGLDRLAIVGLSVGGMWGIHLTLNHPEAVAALVLLDTFVGPEPEESRLRYFGMLDIVEQAGAIPAPMLDTIASIMLSPVTIQRSPDFVNRFKDALASMPAERVPGVVGIGRGIFARRSILDRLHEIDAPTMVVVGADDLARPPHEARQMAEAVPGAHLEVVADAGHICNLEQPEQVTELLQSFLDKALSNEPV
ncbi:alpha/beta fold hydrolase [Chloroflexota bacterium]